MTARSIRRAAERKAIKQARKEEANRRNSLLSTGPRTERGKAISSLNAVKTGLTGRTVLLPTDDTSAYQQHVSTYHTEFQPVGLREGELVQQIADAQWRLQRIPKLEMALYAKGRAELAEEGSELPSERVDAEVYLRYEKSLRNLHLQESRLRRQREKDMLELKALQAERRAAAEDLASFLQPSLNRKPAHAFDPLSPAMQSQERSDWRRPSVPASLITGTEPCHAKERSL